MGRWNTPCFNTMASAGTERNPTAENLSFGAFLPFFRVVLSLWSSVWKVRRHFVGGGFHNVWTTCWYILVPAAPPPPPTLLVLSLPLPPLIPLTHHSSSLAPASLSLSLFPSARITVFFNVPLCFSLAPPLFLSALRRSFSLFLPPSLPPPPFHLTHLQNLCSCILHSAVSL